jgi:hypothetical protein
MSLTFKIISNFRKGVGRKPFIKESAIPINSEIENLNEKFVAHLSSQQKRNNCMLLLYYIGLLISIDVSTLFYVMF